VALRHVGGAKVAGRAGCITTPSCGANAPVSESGVAANPRHSRRDAARRRMAAATHALRVPDAPPMVAVDPQGTSLHRMWPEDRRRRIGRAGRDA